MTEVREEWRPIPGWEDRYEVSSLGRVGSLPRIVVQSNGRTYRLKARILRQKVNRGGYSDVSLSRGLSRQRERVTYLVHHLVSLAFRGEPPGRVGARRGQYTVNHKNGIKTDNRVENLEWVTAEANQRHAWQSGLRDLAKFQGEGNARARLTESDVRRMRRLHSQGEPIVELARRFDIAASTAGRAIRGNTWRHVR